MDNVFRRAIERLERGSTEMGVAADGTLSVVEAIRRGVDAGQEATKMVLQAGDEQQDLRETVAQLQAMVLEQTAKINDQSEELRRLRERLNGHS